MENASLNMLPAWILFIWIFFALVPIYKHWPSKSSNQIGWKIKIKKTVLNFFNENSQIYEVDASASFAWNGVSSSSLKMPFQRIALRKNNNKTNKRMRKKRPSRRNITKKQLAYTYAYTYIPQIRPQAFLN